MRISSGWRSAGIPEIIATLGSDTERGLDRSRVHINRRRWGRNDLWQTGGPFMFFRAESGFSALGYIFMAVAAFSAMAFGKSGDAVFIGIAILIGIVLCSLMYLASGLICRKHSEKWIPYCTVIRGGKTLRLKGTEIVLGDIILLKEGDKVCADVKLISSENLSVTEPPFTKRKGVLTKAAIGSMLVVNGESAPEDFIYAGSVVTNGTGRAVVCAVGADSAQGKRGKIRLVSDKDPANLLFLRKKGVNTGAFAMIFSFAAIAIGVFSPFAGADFIELFLIFLSFAVSAGGEIIPALCCLAYCVSLHDSERSGMVIRDTVGVDYITNCDGITVEDASYMKSSKTELKSIWASGGNVEPKDPVGDDVLSMMLTGTGYGRGKYGREVILAATEHLSDRTDPAKFFVSTENNKPILEHRIIGATHYSLFASGFEQYFSVTGSIEDVISKCTKYRANGHDVPLDHSTVAQIIRAASESLKTATSIIAVAVRVSPYNSMKRLSVLTSDLTFAGFVALDTPAHPKLPASLAYLRENKIPFMFFTDGSGEDINFARKLGILKGRDELVFADPADDAVMTVLSENSVGGAVYANDSEKRAAFLKSARKSGKRIVYFGSDEHIRDAGFNIVCGEPATGSGAYLKKDIGTDASVVIRTVRRSRQYMKRLNFAYRYLFASSLIRAVYSASLLFGIPFVFPSVVLAWGLVFDAVVAGTILLIKKK